MPTLFEPIALGALKASNRAIMAPLTRARATRGHVPTPIMAEYYAQRASAGLIIGEATGISREAVGWPYAPGRMLDAIGVAFLELREPGPDGTFGATNVPRLSPQTRKHFKGPLILNSDYDITRAKADLDSGLADAISFVRPFLANPDLVERLRQGASLNSDEMGTYYSQGAVGYTDYPSLAERKAVA